MKRKGHDGVRLFAKPIQQALILFLRRDALIEKQYHEPVCEGSSGVRLSCPRQRVACKQQLAPWDEIEEVFPFELARDTVAAGDRLENGDVP